MSSLFKRKIPIYIAFLVALTMIVEYYFNTGTNMGSVGFFILPSAYRAFRARSVEATLMLVIGIIIILGNVTVGEVIYPGITGLRKWLLDVPVAASQRGIMIASAVGFIGILMRAVTGIETNWLGGDEEE